MTPDIDRAASAATAALIRHQVSYAPVTPLPILKSLPGVLVLSYAEMASTIGVERDCVLRNLNPENRDASTAYYDVPGKPRYIVAWNTRLPNAYATKALARELGHILLAHNGTRPDDVRNDEALLFARYFLYPRPLIRALQDAGLPLTQELFSQIFGGSAGCIECLCTTPGVRIAPELNRLIRDQFSAYVDNLLSYRSLLPLDGPPADLGTYMDNYEE